MTGIASTFPSPATGWVQSLVHEVITTTGASSALGTGSGLAIFAITDCVRVSGSGSGTAVLQLQSRSSSSASWVAAGSAIDVDDDDPVHAQYGGDGVDGTLYGPVPTTEYRMTWTVSGTASIALIVTLGVYAMRDSAG